MICRYCIPLAIALAPLSIYCHVRTVKSDSALSGSIDRSSFAVVMLYDSSKELLRDRQMRQQMILVHKMFRTASTYRADFKYADVVFIKADVARRDIADRVERYGIHGFPAFLLFNDRRIVRDKKTDKPASLVGLVTLSQLITFIDRHLKNEIRSAAREGRKRRAYYRDYYGPYFSVGVGYPYYPYYPYPPYYYGYPYYGPGAGFSVGF